MALSTTERSGRREPLPRAPWIMRQVWSELLFAHWRVDPARARPLIPPEFQLDVRDGAAWVGVVPFNIPVSRPRWGSWFPLARRFPELNVRTYVTRKGLPGVYFFSLDAASWPAVAAARAGFGLPYFHARMSIRPVENDWIDYASDRGPPGSPARFQARYGPTGPARHAAPGSIEEFLCERYRLFVKRGKFALRSEIDHPRWRLHPAEAEIQVNTMTDGLGLPLEGPPLLHYAQPQDVKIWPIQPA